MGDRDVDPFEALIIANPALHVVPDIEHLHSEFERLGGEGWHWPLPKFDAGGPAPHDRENLPMNERAHHIGLLAEAIVKIADAAGAKGIGTLTGPQVLDLADQTCAEVERLRAELAKAAVWEGQAIRTAERAEHDGRILNALDGENRAELARRDEDRLAFTAALGYGDGKTEPAATLAELIDPLRAALADAREHVECPAWCDECTRWELPRTCEHCKGSGYGGPLIQSVENVQGWSDCDWCSGDGRDHDPDVLETLRAELARRDEQMQAPLCYCPAGSKLGHARYAECWPEDSDNA